MPVRSPQGRATLAAPPETVWAALTDPALYPRLDPSIAALDGRIALGETLCLQLRDRPGQPARFVIESLEAPRQMGWVLRLPLGLLTVARWFVLTPVAGGTECFVREEYSGWLLKLLGDVAAPPSELPGFCAALKAHLEAPTSGG